MACITECVHPQGGVVWWSGGPDLRGPELGCFIFLIGVHLGIDKFWGGLVPKWDPIDHLYPINVLIRTNWIEIQIGLKSKLDLFGSK